jgi:hypothetical protein
MSTTIVSVRGGSVDGSGFQPKVVADIIRSTAASAA